MALSKIEHKQDSIDGGSFYFIMDTNNNITIHVVPKNGGGNKVRISLGLAREDVSLALYSWASMDHNGKVYLKGVQENDNTKWADVWIQWDEDKNAVINARNEDGDDVLLWFLKTHISSYNKVSDSEAFCHWCRFAAIHACPNMYTPITQNT